MMLGSVACISRVEQMGIEALEGLAGRHAQLVKSALYTVAAIFLVFLLLYSWPLALRNAGQTAPASGIPLFGPAARHCLRERRRSRCAAGAHPAPVAGSDWRDPAADGGLGPRGGDLPVIIVGGMVIGAYTATEGGGVAVDYALFPAVFVCRELDEKGLWRGLHEGRADLGHDLSAGRRGDGVVLCAEPARRCVMGSPRRRRRSPSSRSCSSLPSRS
jgi:hypothetical protein